MTTIRGATPGWVRQLGDLTLARRHGEGTLARGLAYAADGHVRSISVADHGGVIMAEVDGSGPHGYTTLITAEGPLDGADDDDELSWAARCSCPVRADCKHAVATLVALRDAAGAPPAATSWRERLAPWVEPSAAAELDETPLGVQLVLVEGRPGPWGERSRRVEVRPVRRSRVGRWVSVGSWSQAQSGPGSDTVPGPHRARAAELVRIAGARSPWGASAPVLLDDLGAEGWAWLQRARADGMEVHGGGVIGRAGLVSEALTVEPEDLLPVVTVTAAAGGGLTAEVAWDGVDADQRVTLLGSPAHTALIEPRGRGSTGGPRTLRPLGSTDPRVAALVAAGRLDIPAGDVGDFVGGYLPGLRRHVVVQSPDGAVDPTATARPLLHVGVRAVEGPGVRLTFSIRYVTGAHRGPLLPVEIPLASPHRRLRRAEAELLRGIPALADVPGCRLGVHDREMHRIPPADLPLVGAEALDVMTRVLPLLEDHDDVEVERGEGLPVFEEADEAPVVTLDVDAPLDGSTDWFDLTVSVLVEGEAVPLAALLVAMRRGDEVLVLPSGTWFRLDDPALAPLRQLLDEAQVIAEATSTTVRLGRYDLGWWEELVATGVVGRQCEAWQRHARVLDPSALAHAAPVPTGLRATLRPYQRDGYQWLCALWDARLGGILADDMGLGKTVQTLALVQRAKEAGELGKPVLVVAPTSVVATWVGEAEKFAPDLVVRPLTRTARARGSGLAEDISGADLVVTSYAVARIDAVEFAAVPWQALVLDEAQQVKNFRSKTYQAVRRLDREVTFTVTGTPIENDLMDLWSQLSLAAPGLFPAPDQFQRQWSRPIAGGDRRLATRLRSRIRPLMLRRTKEEVAPDLPPKTVSVVRLDMTPGHRRIYDRALLRERQRMLGLLEDPEANRVAILAALTRMRQLALDPALVPELAFPGQVDPPLDTLPSSAKIDHLVDQLAELAAEGHRALVFSQFTTFLARVRARLDAAGIGSSYLDGSTRDRQRVISEFKAGEAPVFLISLKAGGVGLTLTEADYVFVLDPWWNPAAEAQAIDRAHRIGQDKPVVVYRLVSADSIEDKVLALQDRKRALADRLVGDDPFTGGLTPADILGLFDPGR